MNVAEIRKLLAGVSEDSVFYGAAQKVLELSSTRGVSVETDPPRPASELADVYSKRARRKARMRRRAYGLQETADVLRDCSSPVFPVAIENGERIGLVFVIGTEKMSFLACIFLDER